MPTTSFCSEIATLDNPSNAVSWFIFGGTVFITVAFLYAVTRHSLKHDNWVSGIVQNHFAATIGLPLAAIAALCLVILLGFTDGPIEFSGLGFNFKGAAGPIVLWVLCFLAIAVAIKALWKSEK